RLRLGEGKGHVVLGAHAGQLDEHGQIHTRDHLHPPRVHDRNGEIGGRSAEHVRQDDDAGATVGAGDSLDNVEAALLHVVLSTDGHRLKLTLRTYDMFHSVAELLRKPPVRDKDDSDHRKTPRQRAGAAPKGAGRRLPLSYLETVKELSSSTARRCETR